MPVAEDKSMRAAVAGSERVPPLLAALTLARRELVRFVRQPNRVFGAVGQPVLFWVLFGAGLGPSFRAPGVTGELGYAEYFFPGALVLIVLFTAIFSTISIIEDRHEGFLQSVLVAPISHAAMVAGKVLGGSALALGEALLFTLLGLTVGLAPTPGGWLLLTLFLFLLSAALVSLGFVMAWRTDSTQGFHAVMSVFLFPMWLLSGAFFPASTGVLGWVVRLNPLTYGVAGVRRLLYFGNSGAPLPPETPPAWLCWSVTLGFALVTFLAACRVSARRTAAAAG